MNLQIRDPRARRLAKKLAEIRRTTMSAAVVAALEGELRREGERESIEEIAADVRASLERIGKAGGRLMTRDEIEDMWWG